MPYLDRKTAWRRTHGVLLMLTLLICLWKLPAIADFLYNDDNINYFFPLMVESGRQIAGGSLPLWNPYVYLGYPLLGDVQSMALYPGTFIAYLSARAMGDLTLLIAVFFLLHVFAAYAAMYLLLRAAGLRRAASCAAALGYALNGFILGVGQFWIVCVVAFAHLPFLFYCIIKAQADGRTFIWSVLAGLDFGLLIYAGYPEHAFHSGVMVAVFLIYRSITTRRIRWVAFGFVVLLLAVLIAAPVLHEGYKTFARVPFNAQTRTFAHFAWGGFGLEALAGMLVPRFEAGWNFFGAFRSSKVVYQHGLALPLALFAFLRGFKHRGLVGVALLLILLIMMGDTNIAGKGINQLLFQIPIVNKTHWVIKHGLAFHFLLTAAAGFGMNRLLDGRRDSTRLFALVCAGLFAVVGAAWATGLLLENSLLTLFEADLFDLLYLLPAVLIVPLLYAGSRSAKSAILIAGVIILLAFNLRLINSYEFYKNYERRSFAEQYTGVAGSARRVLTMTRRDISPDPNTALRPSNYGALFRRHSFNLRTVFPNESAVMLYRGLVRAYFSNTDAAIAREWGRYISRGILPLLGIGEIHMHPDVAKRMPQEIVAAGRPGPMGYLTYTVNNESTLAYAPEKLSFGSDPVLLNSSESVKPPDSIPMNEPLLHGRDGGRLLVHNEKIHGGLYTAKVTCRTADCFMVIPILHHYGWRAEINDSPAKLIKVHGMVMGVRIKQGEQRVRLEYGNPELMMLLWTSLLTILGAAGYLLFASINPRRTP